MLAPLQGFLDREVVGVYKVAAVTAAGLAMEVDPSVSAPITSTSPYGNTFPNVIPASPTVAGSKEVGWLLQPVSATGPSLLSILSQVYDESVPQNATAAVLPPKQGALIATDQYISGAGTGAIKFDNTVTLGTICGITAGQPRVKQAGDEPRLKFMGKVVQRTLTLAAFQIL